MASQLLFHAINQGDLQQAQCLVVEGCADVNHQNSLGETPVHIAAMRGLAVVLELVLAYGADPNVTRHEEYGGWTPLHVSTDKGFVRVTEVLLSSNADPNIPDASGMLPLHLAARSGNEVLALLLLSHGTLPDAPDHFGKPPAYYSIFHNHTGITDLLPQCLYNWKEVRAKEASRVHFVDKIEVKPEREARRKRK